MTAAAVAARCDRARRGGDGWLARCPAHEDRTPSLAVSDGRDGRVLIRCWAGCATRDVLAALGLTWREVCGESRPLSGAEMQAHRRHQRAQRQRQDRLAVQSRSLAARIRRLGMLEIAAVDRVRDIQAGAPERLRGELIFAAQMAAEAAGDVARLEARHDALLSRLRQGAAATGRGASR